MNKFRFLAVTLVISFVLASWGYAGHQAVGIIAENHLTAQTKRGINILLGNQSLGDVASWADDIRDDKTFPQHFINVPLGLTRPQFEQEVKTQPQDNVYKAIMFNLATLRSSYPSDEDKQKALKYIVHFVGDLHQPFHVSRKEDQGGNTIQVQFEGKSTNMHSLWDSELIDKQGLKTPELVDLLDRATPAQVIEWQSDSLMDWLWESYQISTKLYAEVKPGDKLNDDYYRSHIGIVNERIEQAGVRLAGLLNNLFRDDILNQLQRAALKNDNIKGDPNPDAYDGVKRTTKAKTEVNSIYVQDALKYVGKRVEFTCRIHSHKIAGKVMLLNVGNDYPNQVITIVLKGKAKLAIKDIDGKAMLVEGVISLDKGKPRVEINDPKYAAVLANW